MLAKPDAFKVHLTAFFPTLNMQPVFNLTGRTLPRVVLRPQRIRHGQGNAHEKEDRFLSP
jgi:hypothetical protein